MGDIDFDVMPGQCFGFLGPNGAGKTTTLRMVLGVSPMSAGSLHVFGLPVGRYGRAIRQRMGVVPQSDTLDPDFSVAENLRVYGSYFTLSSDYLNRRIPELLNFVELSDKSDRRIGTLSGGMQRRLTIARALINDPEVIVLDEPTTGLDPQVRHMIWGRLKELTRAGKTLLLTTHYMEEAERLCDDLVVMEQGLIIGQGSPQALIKSNVEAEVLEFRNPAPEVESLLQGIQGIRLEQAGESIFCYVEDARILLKELEAAPHISYLHRPANMEDVYLKLTGRELSE